MATLFKKYEFDSEEKVQSKIDALPHVQDEDGNDVPNHKHAIVKLGYLWTTEPTYNEEGEVETEGVRSTKYSVDVLWNDLETSLIAIANFIGFNQPEGTAPIGIKDIVTELGLQMITEDGTGLPNEDMITEQ